MPRGRRQRTIDIVADDSPIRGIAPIYRRVVDLRDAGVSDEEIAATLGVAVEAVPALVDVARRKRANTGEGDGS